jgi:hypothetical protein
MAMASVAGVFSNIARQYGSPAGRANERSIKIPCRVLRRTAASDPNPQERIRGNRSTLVSFRRYDSPWRDFCVDAESHRRFKVLGTKKIGP